MSPFDYNFIAVPFSVPVSAVFLQLFYVDSLRQELPDHLLLALCPLFLFSASSGSFLSAYVLFFLSFLLALPGFLGFGDAKLFLILGLAFSAVSDALLFYAFSFLLNGVLSLVLLLTGQIKKTGTVPMAPAILVSFSVFRILGVLRF